MLRDLQSDISVLAPQNGAVPIQRHSETQSYTTNVKNMHLHHVNKPKQNHFWLNTAKVMTLWLINTTEWISLFETHYNLFLFIFFNLFKYIFKQEGSISFHCFTLKSCFINSQITKLPNYQI